MQRNVLSKHERNEKKYETELKTYLIAKNWWVQKLHGNIYQPGLPDLIVARFKDGDYILIEMKYLKVKDSYYEIDVIESLKGPQTGTILLLAKKKAKICIVAGTKEGFLIVKPPFKVERRIHPLTIEELYEILNYM